MVATPLKNGNIWGGEIDIFLDGYYQRNKILLMTLGVWPEFPKRSRIIVQCLVVLSLLTIVVPQWAFFIQVCDNLEDLATGISHQMLVVIGFVKFCFFIKKKEQIQIILNSVREDWCLVDESVVETIRTFAEKGYLRTTVYMVIIYSAVVIFCLFPLKPLFLDMIFPLNESRPKMFVLQTDYSVFGINVNDHHFMITMHGLFTVTIVVHFLVTIDTFISIIVLHCCGLFEAVGEMLRQIQANFPSERKYKILCDGIIIHHRAITLAESIETSFTIMNGIVVLLAMILISITGLEIIIKMDEPVEVIRYATFAGGVILHLLFISLPGQELSDHSSQVSEGMYAQRLISIMLMRSMKPMQMTAAKFYPQNLESFGKVLKTSFSFFTVMLSNR
ncbi:uncharacterized protein LOC114841601 [Diachasma alloeum]|uniref:Odorant receptor n=1 Tax=Diachasma alloeum TaxID=454923 RepID=A0A4E0RM51_9HYME|nr:uncharacterized protein LOC114841601 [Diachasma alloeum]THK33219.1 odorant receptor 158S [Diachasma alloeum]